MGKVIADMSMSLDGFVADEKDGCDELFGWFFGGDVEVPGADPRWPFRPPAASVEHLRAGLNNVGALVCGRRLYEQTGGWGGTHPIGAPVFVVTHEPPAAWPQGSSSFTFVTEGVAAAVDAARRVAGDKHVAIATPTITQQCLNLRLLDRIQVSLIPVLLGAGLRFFEYLDDVPVRLGDPTVIESRGVTHLYYDVTYPGTRS